MEYRKDELKKKIASSKKILIGIGQEFQTTSEEIELIYNRMEEAFRDKDYFIVSLCTDDSIYHSRFDSKRIVTPCGSIHRYQCEIDCTKELYTEEEYERQSICQKCGRPLIANTAEAVKYNESGYLPQWNAYTKWLQRTLNQDFLILELGIGMQYPGVLRFPVEKVVLYNQKAYLYRVNATISQIPVEIADRACEIHENAIEFIRNEIVY